MSTQPIRIRHHPCARGIAAAALAVLGIEVGLKLLGPESTLIKEHRQVVARALKEPAPDLLVLGDSVARGSILVTTLQDTLDAPLDIRNDALQGTGPVIAYFLLRREIDSGRCPRAILYAPSPHTFATTRLHIAAGSFCTLPEILDLWRHDQAVFDLLGAMLPRLSYSLRYREQIKALAKGDADTRAFFRDPILDESLRLDHYHKQDGMQAPIATSPQPLKVYFHEPFRIAPMNRLYLERLLALADAHGARVYWATPPCLERVYEARQASGFNQDYYRFLDDLAARYPLTVAQREFPRYPEDSFVDLNHMAIPAAMRFSRQLAERLNQAGLGRDIVALGD